MKSRKVKFALWFFQSIFALWSILFGILYNNTWFVKKFFGLPRWAYITGGLIAIIFFLNIYNELRYVKKQSLKNILNTIHLHYFSDDYGEKDPNFRVTYFKPTHWISIEERFKGSPPFIFNFSLIRKLRICWTRKVYLQVYCRSGYMFEKSRAYWCATNSLHGHFDGIAGYAWASGTIVEIDDLPDYDSCNDAEKQAYIKKTFLDNNPWKIEMLNWKARSYKAILIRDRKDKQIGILMLESKKPDGLKNVEAFKLIGLLIQHIFVGG